MTTPEEQLEERLERERPEPSSGFRFQLRAMLLSSRDWPAAERQGRQPTFPFRRVALTYAAAGAACLLVGLAGVAGAGPFAA